MPEHYKVGAEAVKRVSECGRLILFKKEMSNPGKAISNKWNKNK